jgi:hypothetical protein
MSCSQLTRLLPAGHVSPAGIRLQERASSPSHAPEHMPSSATWRTHASAVHMVVMFTVLQRQRQLSTSQVLPRCLSHTMRIFPRMTMTLRPNQWRTVVCARTHAHARAPGSYKPSGFPRGWSDTPRGCQRTSGQTRAFWREAYSSSGPLSALAPNIHRLHWGDPREIGELRRLSRGPEVRPEVSGAATIGQGMSQQG